MGRLQGLGNPDELQQVNPDPIRIIDNTQRPVSDSSKGVWAHDVHIDDYSMIQGNRKAGAYVVWTVRIDAVIPPQTAAGGDHSSSSNNGSNSDDSPCPGPGKSQITIRRRYREFDTLRTQLRYAFPDRKNEIPDLPPKSVVSKFRAAFLENRRKGLEYFLLCVLLNPVFAQSPIIKKFVQG